MVRDSGARLFFTDASVPEFATDAPRVRMDALDGWLGDAAAPPRDVAIEPQWPFNIIYSSGTTGSPKGIVQPHASRKRLRLEQQPGHGQLCL